MNKKILALAALTLALATPVHAETYFGFQIGIGNAPPSRVAFRHRPHVVLVPQTQVYVVDGDYGDADVFQYGNNWYMCEDGYWYRASRYRGPFIAVDVRQVPRPIFHVPNNRWRHHYPGLTNSRSRVAYNRGHDWNRGHDRGDGRGGRGGRDHDGRNDRNDRNNPGDRGDHRR